MVWIGGLVLVLTMLGHDAVMAAVAHSGPSESADHVAQTHVGHHEMTGAMSGASDEGVSSPHPRECGIGGSAVMPGISQPTVNDATLPGASVASNVPTLQLAAAPGWAEAFHPPGVQRALLQVYRL